MVRKIVPGVLALLLAAAPSASAQVETVALFNPSLFETPESIAIDHDNNKYVSLALTGEIRKITPDGTQSTYVTPPLGAPLTSAVLFGGLTASPSMCTTTYANRVLRSGQPRRLEDPRDGQPPARIAALSDAIAAERHRPSP